MRSTLTVLVCGALLLGTGIVLQFRAQEWASFPFQGHDGKTYYQVDHTKQKAMERVSEGVGLLGIILIGIGAFRWTQPLPGFSGARP
jgi:hypothetical protein